MHSVLLKLEANLLIYLLNFILNKVKLFTKYVFAFKVNTLLV